MFSVQQQLSLLCSPRTVGRYVLNIFVHRSVIELASHNLIQLLVMLV